MTRITNGSDLKAARKRLGWSVYQLAAALRLDGSREQVGKRVREMEAGSRPVWGPIAVAVEAFLAGFTPGDSGRPES